ncbi:ATPase GET3B-like isoform X2 [Salvia splendens]|uniref:ATPase GET3B-like isoform X2 n=1 Tax=Salvia splendens TaxID=180675 RepID=UPI001C27C6E1|nr:ATPase GET3B-like isoform X2 [Salvia splendens]
MASLFTHMSKSLPHKHSSAKLSRSIQHLVSAYINSNPLTPSFQGFDEMVSSNQRKFYLLGGKGGVGKTSCAASLAVKLANQGHPTIVVSTDPAHSLSDSFDQNLTGGMLVPVQGVDSPLYALELNPEKAREELSSKGQHDEGAVRNVMDSMGLGGFAGMMGDLKLDELLETSPPGLDEIVAISKVMKFLDSPEYSEFRRIVFDTAPTGHTLRLLSLPDFLDASIGKMMKIKKKIASATAALKSAFGKGEPQQDDNDKLEQLRLSMGRVRDLFRDPETTEFVIVTIPTVMAVNESSRLCASLRKEMVPVNRLVVNQLLPPSASDCKFCSMRKTDQRRALDKIKKDPELAKLKLIESPLVDVEIRGVPALKFMGDMVWR